MSRLMFAIFEKTLGLGRLLAARREEIIDE